MKITIFSGALFLLAGCATLTNDAMTPIAFSFGDGSAGNCQLTNKRGAWSAEIPTTVQIRRSDDALIYDCETTDGREAFGSIDSTMGAEIVASAVFLDFGIVDAITDKHRNYVSSFVIPVALRAGELDSSATVNSTDQTEGRAEVYADLERLNDLRDRGILTDAEFETEKTRLLE
jgi:hypothetical protein